MRRRLRVSFLCATLAAGCASSQWPRQMWSGAEMLYLGNSRGAEQRFALALALAEDQQDPDRVAMSLEARAYARYLDGRPEASEADLDRALALREKRDGPHHPALVYALIGKAKLYQRDPNRRHEMLETLGRIVALHAAAPTYRPDDAKQALWMALAFGEAARTLHREGRLAEAEPLYRRGVDGVGGAGDRALALGLGIVQDYAALLDASGRTAEAHRLRARFAMDAADYLKWIAFPVPINDLVALRWPRAEMPLRVFLSRPPDGLFESPDAVFDSVRDGVLDWSDGAGPGLPTFRFVDDPGEADIPIMWAAEPDGDWYAAHCAWDPIAIQRRKFGVSRILVTGRWRDGHTADLHDLYKVVLHEMGHALGVGGHSPHPDDIMYAGLTPFNHALSGRDRATLALLYQRPIGSQIVGARRN